MAHVDGVGAIATLTPQQEHYLDFNLLEGEPGCAWDKCIMRFLVMVCVLVKETSGVGRYWAWTFAPRHQQDHSILAHTYIYPTKLKHEKTKPLRDPVRAGSLPGHHGQRLHSHRSQPAAIFYAPTITISTPSLFFHLLSDRHGRRGPGRCRARTAGWCPGSFGSAGFAGCSRWYVE